MQGDFSLDPLKRREDVSRVLLQQGRVLLDSDWNTQVGATLGTIRDLAVDVIGPHGGVGDSFKIEPFGGSDKTTFRIRYGRYYVDGIRCLNAPPVDLDVLDPDSFKSFDAGLPYASQPFQIFDEKQAPLGTDPLLIYLDVWERHVSSAEDESIREVALGGPDTASRAVVIWQVRTLPIQMIRDASAKYNNWGAPGNPYYGFDPAYVALNAALGSSALLRAQAVISQDVDPCVIAPDSRYRGLDNRLYRVEIHEVKATSGNRPDITFKWSRDNGSLVYPVNGRIESTTVKLDSLGRDDRTSISAGDWVEVVDDESTLMNRAHPLIQVTAVDRARSTVTLQNLPEGNIGGNAARHPVLRRWESEPQPVSLSEKWTDLGEGVQVQFSQAKIPSGGFRRGDYWLIPARVATGDVLWPRDDKNVPALVPPHGVRHHYAPLAEYGGTSFTDVRRTFLPLAKFVTA